MGLAQSFTFYDAKQQQARVSMFIAGASTAAEQANGAFLAVDMANMSNTSTAAGGAVRGHGPYTNLPVPVSAGTQADYLDIADKAVMVFQDAQGGLHKYQIPCPITAIFQADQETVDFTNAAVKQFVADMTFTTFGGTAPQTTTAVQTRNAVNLVASVGGYRRRGKAPRRFNIYTRNSGLSGGGGAP